MKRSQNGRLKPSFATGPASVNWTYAREDASNFGHNRNSPPLGLPVLAKLVQYFCIACETCVSTTVTRNGGAPISPTRSSVPNTYDSSDACVAPILSFPNG